MNLRSLRQSVGKLIAGKGQSYSADETKALILAAMEESKAATLASTLPLYFFGRPLMQTDWTTDKAVRDGLKVHPWVYACVDAYVDAIAVAPVVAQEWSGSQWVDLPDHQIERRFERPNKKHSRQDMVARNVQDLLLDGNMLSSVVDSDTASRGTLELWALPPDNCSPVPDPVDLVSGYRVSRWSTNTFYPNPWPVSDQNSQYVPARDMVHVMFHDPSNPYWGLSPLQAASRVVDTDVSAIRWNLSMLENRTVTGGIFTTPQPLAPKQHSELKAILKSEVSGATNAYSPMLLSHGTTWQDGTRSPVDMDFVEGRKLSILDICAVYRIPAPLLGLSENATLANLLEYRRGWYEDSVIPLGDVIMAGYNRAWVWPRWGDKIRLAFKWSLVPALLPQLVDKVTVAKGLATLGWSSNVISRFLDLGLPDIEGDFWVTKQGAGQANAGDMLDLLQALEERIKRLEGRRK